MSQKVSTSKSCAARVCWRDAALSCALGATLLGAPLIGANSAQAQSWSEGRSTPPLWQIIAVDKTGETLWPYGREDIANDGLGTFLVDEAGSDLRTVYADADADNLWLRAYLAGTAAPSDELRAYIFVDTDSNASTGGAARGTEIDAALTADPSKGGYEWAIALAGSSNTAQVFRWESGPNRWSAFDVRPASALNVEFGTARDPLGFVPSTRGYAQFRIAHSASGLSASCAANILVRLRHAGAGTRVFGDDAPDDVACAPSSDPYGDPEVLRTYECKSDTECFSGGKCRDGLCVFAYDCTEDRDCLSNERCTANKCVRTLTTSCTSDAQCDGLVCDAGRCVTCAETGARACDGALVCSPNGACQDPRVLNPNNPSKPNNGGNGSDVDAGPGRVEGGALNCAAHTHGGTSSAYWLGTLAVIGLFLQRKRVTGRSAEMRGDHD